MYDNDDSSYAKMVRKFEQDKTQVFPLFTDFGTLNGEEFIPTIRLHALAMRVLTVAKTRIEGSWAAYIDSVPGECHEGEAEDVLRHGDKLPENVARILFPEFTDLPYEP